MNIDNFIKERNEALLSLDKKNIIAYCKKYGVEVTSDEKIFWAGIHKAILQIKSITPEQRERSEKWLQEHGFKTNIC